MGVEPGLFSPLLRSPDLRRAALAALGLEPGAVLLIGIGRLSPEKRWELVLRAAGECGRKARVGMLLVGDGSRRRKLQMLTEQYRNLALLPPITDRAELASLLASADALVHGCESETFCLVAAEARASGIPLIVPDRGAAVEQLAAGSGTSYAAGRERSLERAILRFIDRGPEQQRAAAVSASNARTMDEHFADLFARYGSLPSRSVGEPAREAAAPLDPRPELALAPSTVRSR
jgi:alpha-1,6-mannosyltransferase